MFLVCFVSFRLVGEEDEMSIKEAVDAVVEGFGFEGEVIVSFLTKTVRRFFLFLQLIEQQSSVEHRYLVDCS